MLRTRDLVVLHDCVLSVTVCVPCHFLFGMDGLQPVIVAFLVTLAHRIRISEILPWERKSYLTQAF